MKIWGAANFGNPVRVAIFLKEKKIDVPFEPVDLFAGAHKTSAFRKKNPASLVPVLELDDGTCISETIAICRYFERLHPEPPLMGRDPLDEAIVEMWQRRVEFSLFESVRAVFRHSMEMVKVLEPVQIAAWADLNRPRVTEALEMFEGQLKDHPFIAGKNFTVADITAVLPLQMMSMLGIEVPPHCPAVAGWREAILSRPSVTAVTQPPAGKG